MKATPGTSLSLLALLVGVAMSSPVQSSSKVERGSINTSVKVEHSSVNAGAPAWLLLGYLEDGCQGDNSGWIGFEPTADCRNISVWPAGGEKVLSAYVDTTAGFSFTLFQDSDCQGAMYAIPPGPVRPCQELPGPYISFKVENAPA